MEAVHEHLLGLNSSKLVLTISIVESCKTKTVDNFVAALTNNSTLGVLPLDLRSAHV